MQSEVRRRPYFRVATRQAQGEEETGSPPYDGPAAGGTGLPSVPSAREEPFLPWRLPQKRGVSV